MADEGKLPSIHLYPGDWLRDNVSGCSLAAQGLWLRMMFIAHDSDRYGYLSMNGKAIPPEHTAARCGIPLEQYLTLLDELTDAGVPSRTPEGIIFSRRMVRDAKERQAARERQRRKRGKDVTPMSRSCHGHVTPNEDEDEDEKSISQGIGVQGKGGIPPPDTPPPEGTFSHLVPIAWDSLLDAWAGRRIMPLQVEMLGERIQRFGESLVKRALEMHVKAGKAHGNLTYLDKILEGGAQERGEVQQDEIARGVAKAVERQRRKRDGS